VLAQAADACFCQLNGSYLKCQVKGVPSKVQPCQAIKIKITKVEGPNIRADFLAKIEGSSEQDQTAKVVYQSVTEESRQDVILSQSGE
jgi:hypothetical protein